MPPKPGPHPGSYFGTASDATSDRHWPVAALETQPPVPKLRTYMAQPTCLSCSVSTVWLAQATYARTGPQQIACFSDRFDGKKTPLLFRCTDVSSPVAEEDTETHIAGAMPWTEDAEEPAPRLVGFELVPEAAPDTPPYGNLDIIFGPFSRFSSCMPPHTRRSVCATK